MAEHPGISLVVVPLVQSTDVSGEIVKVEDHQDDPGTSSEEIFLDEIKHKFSGSESVSFEERVVRSTSETIDTVREYNKCNMFLVGRMQGGQVAATMNVKSECPEPGPVANLLISLNFLTSASVLVVQQYTSPPFLGPMPPNKVAELPQDDYLESPDTDIV